MEDEAKAIKSFFKKLNYVKGVNAIDNIPKAKKSDNINNLRRVKVRITKEFIIVQKDASQTFLVINREGLWGREGSSIHLTPSGRPFGIS